MSRRLVLMVEDDPDDIELTLLHLRGLLPGCDFETAWDGLEALERLRGPGPRPDLVLADLKMPRVNGLEMLERMRADAALKDLPVAFLTSSGNEKDLDEALRLGARQYHRKPASPEEFRRVAEELKTLL